LGALNLQTQNEALLLKHWHKIFNRADVPWVHLIWECYYNHDKLPNHVRKGSFWWRDLLHLLERFKEMASVTIHDGRTCNFWEDAWNGQAPKLNFPELFSFTKRGTVTFKKVKAQDTLWDFFSS
jgi:hypothetical protein